MTAAAKRGDRPDAAARIERDVLIVGSGAAAMTAAVAAARSGLDVLLVEKDEAFGGTSALSGGILWIPCNPLMTAASSDPDSPERAMRYLNAVIGPGLREEMLAAYVKHGPEMVGFLAANSEVRFRPTAYPDYQEHLDGGMLQGRSISAEPFDARELGRWRRRLRRPFREWCVLGSMMVNPEDLVHFLKATRSLRSFARVVRLVAAFGLQYLRYGSGIRYFMGSALMGRLLKSALDAKVELWSGAPAVELLYDGGRVQGALVRKGGELVEVRTRRGVVLGAGGFPHDEALKKQLIPFADRHETLCVPGNTGDGLRMAMDLGSVLGGDMFQTFVGTQVPMMRTRSGEVIRIPAIRRDRVKPGFILVDRNGRRYANEAWPYNELAKVMVEDEARIPSYIICDHVRLRRYGLGLVRPGPAFVRPLGAFLRSGHLVKAPTIAALGRALDMDPDGLGESVARNNEFARTGKDEDFGKGDTAYDRWQGDAEVTPNPTLGPIETPPYYAVAIWPGNIGTTCGLLTDPLARVLDRDGTPIHGLYACGTDMHSIFSGQYPGGGSTLGPGMTFGYVAGMTLAGRMDGVG